MIFKDRHEAGKKLVPLLAPYKGQSNTIVLGLARGGVVVAYEIAKGLSLPLNVIAPRKVGAPNQHELAIGAVMEDGTGVFNDHIIQALGIPRSYITQEIEIEKARSQRYLSLYRQNNPLPDLKGYTVILADDGIATGATMLAAIRGMKKMAVSRIVVAVPVAAVDALQVISQEVDEVVCLYSPEDFGAVGYFFYSFQQTEDEEVIELLKEANRTYQSPHSSPQVNELVHLSINGTTLEGDLIIPKEAQGIVLFAHGSGSSRYSPRNRAVAEFLRHEGKLATLLIDLLNSEEDEIDEVTRELRFNILFLAERLIQITEWLQQDLRTKHLPIGYFGASTGAAAALVAASQVGDPIKAIVSRGGRPDLALDYLKLVKAPTLLIVGGDDIAVIELNQKAFKQLNCQKSLEIVPNATHLFEEPGALEQVSQLAYQWFKKYLII